jgi:hypothetical protein
MFRTNCGRESVEGTQKEVQNPAAAGFFMTIKLDS